MTLIGQVVIITSEFDEVAEDDETRVVSPDARLQHHGMQ
jgi:hypothetical protein